MTQQYERSGVCIEELNDFGGTLEELRVIIEERIKTHGKNQLVAFNVGANNVQVELMVKKTRRIKEYSDEAGLGLRGDKYSS